MKVTINETDTHQSKAYNVELVAGGKNSVGLLCLVDQLLQDNPHVAKQIYAAYVRNEEIESGQGHGNQRSIEICTTIIPDTVNVRFIKYNHDGMPSTECQFNCLNEYVTKKLHHWNRCWMGQGTIHASALLMA